MKDRLECVSHAEDGAFPTAGRKRKPFSSRRFRTLLILCLAVAMLVSVTLWGAVMNEEAYAPNFAQKNQPPSLTHLLGTDWMGRDMLFRTVKGMSISIAIGLPAAAVSACVALTLSMLIATFGHRVDACVSWLIDLLMGVPHIVLLILISFAAGKGVFGVALGVVCTHWMSLTRVLRADVLQTKSAPYIAVSRKLGKTPFFIARKHILPHLIPQFTVGLILLFPHAILHEASLTFLGFGLPSEMPAIGVILSESMRFLSTGQWWLAFFPGLFLVVIVVLFDVIGENVRLLIDPYSAHE